MLRRPRRGGRRERRGRPAGGDRPRLSARAGRRGPRLGPARRLRGRRRARGSSGSILAAGRRGRAPAPPSRAPSIGQRAEKVPADDGHPMLDDVLAIPDHLRDALWRVDSARLERSRLGRAPRLRHGRLGDRRRPRRGGARRAPRRGRWSRSAATSCRAGSSSDWTVLCSSYSGDTEETLACFEAATAVGARRIVASTGGALVDRAREDGVPVIGLPGHPAAARGGRLHVRRRRSRSPPWPAPRPRIAGRDRGRRRPASSERSRRPARRARPRSPARLEGTVAGRLRRRA